VRILIVDDNLDAAQTLEQLLVLVGYTPQTAFNGATALEVADLGRSLSHHCRDRLGAGTRPRPVTRRRIRRSPDEAGRPARAPVGTESAKRRVGARGKWL
jgi:CheY-like chemotaxis protein